MNDPARLAEELPVLLDATTGRQEYEMVPRINVMTAPREVLMALTAIAQSAAQASAQSTSQTSTSTTMTTTNSSQTGSSSTSLDETDVDAILAARDSLSPTDPDVQSGAWVVTQANVTPKKFAQLERYITSRSMVYRVQSIGYFSQNGPVARVEAVIDTHLGTPRILYYRDLTDLDIPRGFTPPR
ncbi:MAG: hypothetical protein LC104_04145 [Bacteroidales bacterium]|nr:hypothetical protein [Bacteroidales bacterium]